MRLPLLVGALLVISGCAGVADERVLDDAEEHVSPSGEYSLSLPAEESDDGKEYWFVTITDVDGNEVYRDEEAEFPVSVPVYWVWDEENRAWLYSTDSGRVYVWINSDEGWQKHLWGLGKYHRKYREAIEPPEHLFPEV